jgi:hypothetical protein
MRTDQPLHCLMGVTLDPTSALTSVCACGWVSTPARSDVHAHERWRIHSAQHRAMAMADTAVEVCRTLERRFADIGQLRATTVCRRREVAAHRVRLRVDAAARREPGERRRRLRLLGNARDMTRLSPIELWIRYYALGGRHGSDALEAALAGTSVLSLGEHNVVATVYNECFAAEGLGHPIDLWRSTDD